MAAAAPAVRSTTRRVNVCSMISSLEALLPGDHLAAVDLDHLAGHIGTVLAGEERRHARDLLRLADAFERDRVDHLPGRRFAPAREGLARLVGIGEPDGNDVGADAVAAFLARDHADE